MAQTPVVPSPPAPFTLTVVDPASTDQTAAGRREAADLLDRAVGPDHADDRFEPYDQPDDGSVLVLGRHGEHVVAAVAANSSRGRFQFDVIADAGRIATLAGGGGETARQSLLLAMIDQATAAFDERSTVSSSKLTPELWGRPRQPWHDRLAGQLQLVPVRSLYQMRCPLPISTGSTATDRTRPIEPGVDTERLLNVNNRAFAAHPDQSNQQLSDLEGFTSASFRPPSVRILDADPADDRAADHPMIGFCWTKIHPERTGRPPLGEIYVIAVDPAYHGEGHGTGLTSAGLAWLTGQGLTTGMLYVESDNEPAVATYRKLGFTVHGTYTAWSHP